MSSFFSLMLNCRFYTKCAIVMASVVAVAASSVHADSLITWQGPSAVSGASSIRNNGTAVDEHTQNRRGVDHTINAVFFTGTGSQADEDQAFWTNNGGASTGNADLDGLINHHSNASGAAPLNLALTGLTSGNQYQIQLIVAHDGRGCCSARSYSIGDGLGGDSGFDLARGAGGNGATGSLLGTMVGTFTADSTGIQNLQVGGFGGDGVDAALSGYALRNITTAIPEPGSLALLGLGMAGLALSRRRK